MRNNNFQDRKRRAEKPSLFLSERQEKNEFKFEL